MTMAKKTLCKMTPVAWTRVRMGEGFWHERMEVNRTVTLPIEHAQCKKTGRLDAWKLNWRPGGKGERPHVFWDSDVAKWIEAVGYSLGSCPDKKLQGMADRTIDLMAKAQQADGYLNVHFTVVEPGKRWSNLRDWHELYCAGHLMEAAVAYYEGTGRRTLLDVMCRYADCIGEVFGPRRGQKRGVPGHEEIELALVKLYRATGRERYLELASFFVDERGTRPHYFTKEAKARGDDPKDFHFRTYDYCQAHVPVRQQDTVVGHAVRAMYLYSGMADVAAETGDRTLLDACRRLWKNVTQKRMYITGGIGPTHRNEGFTVDYDLPNETAYAETCAAIGLVFWAHRMLHLDPDGRYADVMERALYNGVLSGVSLDGARFFYGNPLAKYPAMSAGGSGSAGNVRLGRQEWFGCACCPPNVARLISSLGGYVYSAGRSEAWVHLYAAGEADLDVGGRNVRLVQKTNYPWRGKVRIAVCPDSPMTFTLAMRIPGWCRGASLAVNGRGVRLADVVKKGYARVRRQWRRGDRVELSLPMPVERIEAHPSVRHDAGRVALQRGPIVYCLEEVDNGADLGDIALPRSARPRVRFDSELFGGAAVITAPARRRDRNRWRRELYRPAEKTAKTKAVAIKAIPYFMWANRRVGEMVVWIRDC